jgi:hypothetical protein
VANELGGLGSVYSIIVCSLGCVAWLYECIEGLSYTQRASTHVSCHLPHLRSHASLSTGLACIFSLDLQMCMILNAATCGMRMPCLSLVCSLFAAAAKRPLVGVPGH